jgi:hypothetical protein
MKAITASRSGPDVAWEEGSAALLIAGAHYRPPERGLSFEVIYPNDDRTDSDHF